MSGLIRYPTIENPPWEPEPLPLTIYDVPPEGPGHLGNSDRARDDRDDTGRPGSHVIVIDLA